MPFSSSKWRGVINNMEVQLISNHEEMFIFIFYFSTSQDFDPAEHDAMVAKMFDNDYYEGEGAAQDEKLPGKHERCLIGFDLTAKGEMY